jgi:hypothetical protein
MRIPDPPTTTLMASPTIATQDPTRPDAPFIPFDPTTPTQSFCPQTPPVAVSPHFETQVHPTRSSHARRFDEVGYGDYPKSIDESNTRFVLNNPNGVTRDGSYDHLSAYLLDLLEIGVDVIQLPEANVDWRRLK